MPGAVYTRWMLLQRVIGPARFWPPMVRRLFWKPNLNAQERKTLALFCFVNGATLAHIFRFALATGIGQFPTPESVRHVRAIYRICSHTNTTLLCLSRRQSNI